MIRRFQNLALALTLGLFLIPSFASAASFNRPLSQGMSGPDVSALQTVLKEKGFYTFPTVTGYFGPVTKDALAKYQASVGLEAVGQVGPKTLALLNGGVSTSPSTLSSLVTALQQLLRNAGYDEVSLTGTLDAATLSAAQSVSSGSGDAPRRSVGGSHSSHSDDEEIVTPDTTAPAISAIASSTAQTTATITWTTDEASDSRVDYGASSSYGTASTSGALSTSHSITLTGLTASTLYHFRVQSADAATNIATSSDLTFTTAAVPDTTPPVISSISSGTPGQTSVTIMWTTNEASDSRVDLGLTASYGTASTSAALSTSHSITYTGLTASTLYHYRVQSTDAASNIATSSDQTFTTSAAPDTTPPVISGIASSTSQTSATISWTTNEAATSVLNYGLSSSYGSASSSATLVTSHTINLSGLTAATLYHFQIQSLDAASNIATSSDLTFTTAAAADVTPPVLSAIASSTATTTATITWTTNEAADSRIDYGTTTAYGTASTSATLLTSHSLTLTGLTASTTYHFRVQSADAATNTATSSDLTFITAGYDIDAAALFARMSTPPSEARKTSIDTYIRSLKTAGLWTKFDAVYSLAAADTQSAYLNWKGSTYNLTANGTVTFTANQGVAGDGTTGYLATAFTPSSATSPNYVLNSASVGVVTNTATSSGTSFAIGTNNSTMRLKTSQTPSNSPSGFINDATPLTGTTGTGVVPGLSLLSRTSSTTKTLYKNADSVANNAFGTSTTLANQPVWFLRNASSYSQEQVPLGFIGAGLSGSEVTAFWGATRDYLQAIERPVAAWGDSLTYGQNVSSGQSPSNYPSVIQSSLGRPFFNGGIQGQTSTGIKDRMVADTFYNYGTTVIWAGRNNYTAPATVKADIASMVAHLNTNRFVVLSIINGNYPTELIGQADYNTLIQLNTDLQALYPNNYLDVRAPLVAAYNAGIPQDVTDHANDIPPSSLRNDNIHLTDPGYAFVANLVQNFLTSKGW